MIRSGAAARRQGSGPLFRVDFTTLTPGGIVTLPSGLLVSRASVATSQTGASTLATGIAVDTARVDDSGATRGLLLEESRTNLVKGNRIPTAAGGNGWSGAAVGVTSAAGLASPDGTSNGTRWTMPSAKVSAFQVWTRTAGAPFCVSNWVLASVAGVGQYQGSGRAGAAGGTSAVMVKTTTASWQRLIGNRPNTENRTDGEYQPGDTNTNTAAGGVGAAAMDFVTDLHQQEAGSFSTSDILTIANTTATRAGERLYHPTATSLVRSNRLALEVKVRPLGSSSQYGNNMRLWTVDANNFCEIDKTTRVLTVTVAGSASAFGTAIPTWTVGDTLEIYCESGGGTLPTYASARVNGAAKTVLGTNATLGTVPSGGALDLLCNGTAAQFSARVQTINAYPPGTRPAWA